MSSRAPLAGDTRGRPAPPHRADLCRPDPVTGRRRTSRPLLPRLLGLRVLSLRGWQRSLIGDGPVVLAVLLCLADLSPAELIVALPATVWALTVLHDRLAAGLARPAPPPAVPGVPQAALRALGAAAQPRLLRVTAVLYGVLEPLAVSGSGSVAEVGAAVGSQGDRGADVDGAADEEGAALHRARAAARAALTSTREAVAALAEDPLGGMGPRERPDPDDAAGGAWAPAMVLVSGQRSWQLTWTLQDGRFRWGAPRELPAGEGMQQG